MTNDTAEPMVSEKVQLATRIRRETNEQLSRMSEISGMPKAEIVDRAIEAFELRIVEAAKVLKSSAPAQQAQEANEQPAIQPR